MPNWNDDFDDEELERERKEEARRVANLPIVKKAADLLVTICAFVETFSEDEFNLKQELFNNAAVINAKIRGAEAGDLFGIRMENAVLIKVNALEIRNTVFMIETMGIGDADYIEVIRDEVDEFRKVFVAWVASFDRTNDYDDEWGIWGNL